MAGRAELADILVNECGCSKRKGLKCVALLFDRIAQEAAQGGIVTIKGFGTFQRKIRVGRDYFGQHKPDRSFLVFSCMQNQRLVVESIMQS